MLRMMPESVREGSSFISTKCPKFVVGIYAIIGKGANQKKSLVATGWRYKDYILTAGHAVRDSSFAEVVISHNGKFFTPTEWFDVGPDLAAARCRPEWQIPAARIETINHPAHVQIFSACEMQNSSMGVLKHVPTVAMGFVEYSGSTRAAFSGAPYYNGMKVLGMHLGGGSVGNYGYSASYIDMLFKIWCGPESSELEFLRRVLNRARKSDFEYESGLDETRLRIGGRYMVIDNIEFEELMMDEEYERFFYDYDEIEGKSRKTKVTRRWREMDEPEYEPEADIPQPEVPRQQPSQEKVEDDFLESTPPKVSTLGALALLTDSPLISMLETRLMSTLTQAITRGQQEVIEKLEQASMSAHLSAEQRLQDLGLQIETSLTTRLDQALLQTQSDLDDRFCQMRKDLMDTLNTVSENSTRPAQLDSGNSAVTVQSDKHWDGMESDLRRYKEWASSKDPLSRDYVPLREAFLTTTLGLNATQKAILVSRYRNQRKATQRKRVRAAKQTPSSSS